MKKFKARTFMFTQMYDFAIDLTDNIDIGNKGGYSSEEIARYHAEHIAKKLGIQLEWRRDHE